jgi:hypothetical protein
MKKRPLLLALLALGLQGVAHAQGAADSETRVHVAAAVADSPDEVWGIGRRTPQPQTSTPGDAAEANADAGVAELEAAFWMCDYIATTRGVESTPVALCGSVYDELKTVKFSGDFGALLAWWKQNKPVEHRKIASEQTDAAVERKDIRL